MGICKLVSTECQLTEINTLIDKLDFSNRFSEYSGIMVSRLSSLGGLGIAFLVQALSEQYDGDKMAKTE